MKVYLDNAATTPLAPEVIQEMFSVMQEKFGNPSSIHSYGREARSLIEQGRKYIAGLFNVTPGEIFLLPEQPKQIIWLSVVRYEIWVSVV